MMTPFPGAADSASGEGYPGPVTLVLKLLTVVSFIGGPLLLSDAWSPKKGCRSSYNLWEK